MKQVQVLDGTWMLKIGEEESMIQAKVPGSVYCALLDCGRMEDPYWRDNEMKALPWMENDFLFTCSFSVAEEIWNQPEKILRFEGIDTIGEVYLNDVLLGKVQNMHLGYEFPVADILKEKDNELKIKIFSPTRYIKEENEKCFADGSLDAMVGFPHIRKAHCMFGWDWGARIPDAGIFRSVSLDGFEGGLVDSVHILQYHEDGKVRLGFEPETKYVKNWVKAEFFYTVTGPDGVVYETDEDELTIDNPKLWWPNGFGEHPLYTVRAEMRIDGKTADTWEKRIGLRTLTMHREEDEWGESFAAEVNGVQIFSMGADYIPEDSIFSRINEERTRGLLEDCIAANYNTVRIWGGGYYPDDYFFDICDELGLLVWHDLMFACAIYELSKEFEENITEEIICNVKRLRNHPSIALWCGNNEMEWQVDDKVFEYTHKQRSDYVKMYEYIFPKIVEKYDRQRFYWSSSPSSGGGFDYPNDPNRGDVHYWDVWHGCKPFSDYRNYYFRYASEFGFQSFPSIKTVETFTEPEDRNIFSYVMEKHQRNKSANGKILSYLADMFLYPGDFGTLLYASQILQAEAVKYGVEHWRRNRGRCMGAIYWQLNDCWPVASWASIDYEGRWKALHYYAKRFFAPVMISCCEEGILTQDTNVNAENPNIEKSVHLSAANETMEDVKTTVRFAVRDAFGKEIKSGTCDMDVPALSSVWLEKMDMADVDEYSQYFSFGLEKDGAVISDGTVLFCQPKHFKFENPHLRAEVRGDTITVYADAYAKSVEIDCTDSDMVLSDNYFDMNAGSRTVKILRGKPGTLSLRSIYDIR